MRPRPPRRLARLGGHLRRRHPGQELPITGLPDGRYALIVAMDYPNRIAETNDADNTLEVVVELAGTGTETPEAFIVDKRLRGAGDD